MNSQLYDNRDVTPQIRRSIHSQLFVIGDRPRAVARRNHVTDADAVQIALQVEREDAADRLRRAYTAARLSALARPHAA